MASSLVKSIRISPDLWNRVERYAALNDLSANAGVMRLLEESLPNPLVVTAPSVKLIEERIAFGPQRAKPGSRLKGPKK